MTRTTNPHYYNWIRENHGNLPREEGDIPCDEELPTLSRLIQALSRVKCMPPPRGSLGGSIDRTVKQIIYDNTSHLHRIIGHINSWSLRGSRFNNAPVDNLDYRKRYLKRSMSVEEFKHKIQIRDKAQEKKASNRLIAEMFCAVGTDILIRIDRLPVCCHQDILDGSCEICSEILTNIITEIKNLIKYTNSRYKANAKLYNMRNYYRISQQQEIGVFFELPLNTEIPVRGNIAL